MKKTGRIALLALALAAALFAAAAGCRRTDADGPGAVTGEGSAEAGTEKAPATVALGIRAISKHGNLILDTTFEELAAAGVEIGDLILVCTGSAAYEMPVGTSYTDVDSGEMICRFDPEDSEVALAINYGSFAGETGVAEKQTVEEDPGYKWEILVSGITLSLKEKGGYLAEYRARNLTRTDGRADYPALSDEEFANFRAVASGAVRENTLYRSSTPIEPALGRNGYAMAAMEKAGIRTVVNLDDSPEEMKRYAAYPGSYYSGCAIVNPEMSYEFESADFSGKVRESVLFLIANDAPFLIHCKEGKDRTGILCAILECFAGASEEEVDRDYMITYANYYGVKQTDPVYAILLENNLKKTLRALFRIEKTEGADLAESARRYLLSTGLSEEQLGLLGQKLKKA